uniref:Liprin-beta-1 n=1 Tax=Culex pipiens TaxID=7175 RepID=A0A8D8C097_CULPI
MSLGRSGGQVPSDTDASDLLEAVLKQMDGIILGATNHVSSPDGGASSNGGIHHGLQSTSILAAAQSLAMSLQQQTPTLQPSPDPITAGIISTWLDTHLPRQDTDERLRRLQSDKEAMALQVKLLTDQVQQQGTKISDLERTLADKNQLLANADDLLQREMLSRSSLETQKLELMSAMSELKLQQAALERENLELRSSLVNGTPLTNGTLTNGAINALNNNTIVTASMLRRAIPMGTSGARMVSSNSSGNTSINTSPLHHGSYGSLPQSQQATSPSPVTPKTPPATYRQRVDLHYSSLPRQAFATTLSTTSGSSGSAHSGLTNGNGTPSVDANANPKQRNVAFGNYVATTLENYIASINQEAAALSAIDPPPKQKQPSIPVGMSSSMNALTLSSALGSNLKSLKQASASAQNIYSCDERREDEDEQQLIDLGQDHQERATTEPPTGTTLSVAQPNQESLLEAASTPVLAGRDRSSTSSTVDLKTLEMMRGGFSVPNLGSYPTTRFALICLVSFVCSVFSASAKSKKKNPHV